MKKLFILFTVLVFSSVISANGVAIVNAASGTYLKLNSSNVTVSVKDQVAITVVNQVFKNSVDYYAFVKYAFPLTEKQSPTNLRWKVDGKWNEAVFSPRILLCREAGVKLMLI